MEENSDSKSFVVFGLVTKDCEDLLFDDVGVSLVRIKSDTADIRGLLKLVMAFPFFFKDVEVGYYVSVSHQHKALVQNKLLEGLYVVHIFLVINEVRFFVFKRRKYHKTLKIRSNALI